MPISKWSFCPISVLCSKNNPRNIKHMPVVICFACLDLEQKSSFMDGHWLTYISYFLVSGRVSLRTNYFIRYNPKSFSSNFGLINCAPTVRSIIHNILTRVRTSILIGLSKVNFNSTKSSLEKLCGLRVAKLIPVFEMSSMSISSVSSFPWTKYLPVS